MTDRYSRNMNTLSPEECALIRTKSVCVVGCGGLGGYIIELLGRIGIGRITAVDGDVFDVTNLNRQLFSDETVIGKSKAFEAKKRMEKVNSDVIVDTVYKMLDEDNAENILKGHDLVIDALDGVPTRRIIEKACAHLGITLVHGAVAGWNAQVAVIPPGAEIFDKLYPRGLNVGTVLRDGTLSCVPAVCASIEVSEAVKILCGRPSTLENKLLVGDMLTQKYRIINLK